MEAAREPSLSHPQKPPRNPYLSLWGRGEAAKAPFHSSGGYTLAAQGMGSVEGGGSHKTQGKGIVLAGLSIFMDRHNVSLQEMAQICPWSFCLL